MGRLKSPKVKNRRVVLDPRLELYHPGKFSVINGAFVHGKRHCEIVWVDRYGFDHFCVYPMTAIASFSAPVLLQLVQMNDVDELYRSKFTIQQRVPSHVAKEHPQLADACAKVCAPMPCSVAMHLLEAGSNSPPRIILQSKSLPMNTVTLQRKLKEHLPVQFTRQNATTKVGGSYALLGTVLQICCNGSVIAETDMGLFVSRPSDVAEGGLPRKIETAVKI